MDRLYSFYYKHAVFILFDSSFLRLLSNPISQL